MNKTLLLATSLLVFTACKNKSEQSTVSNAQPTTETPAEPAVPELHTELYGNYMGAFKTPDAGEDYYIEQLDYSAPINVSITRITAEGVEGKSVVKGLMRPFTGKMTQAENAYHIIADEPGDDKHDGRFEFTLAGDSIKGSWTAFDPSVKQNKKMYVLHKKAFAYNPNLMLDPNEVPRADIVGVKTKEEKYRLDDGTEETYTEDYFRMASPQAFKLNASKQELTEGQLKNLKKLDLEIIRNTIFARHGYSFGNKKVRQFFELCSWYAPVTNNVDAELTELERKNIALLQRFEKYATDNYDTFGR